MNTILFRWPWLTLAVLALPVLWICGCAHDEVVWSSVQGKGNSTAYKAYLTLSSGAPFAYHKSDAKEHYVEARWQETVAEGSYDAYDSFLREGLGARNEGLGNEEYGRICRERLSTLTPPPKAERKAEKSSADARSIWRCGRCRAEVDPGHTICPGCGARFTNTQGPPRRPEEKAYDYLAKGNIFVVPLPVYFMVAMSLVIAVYYWARSRFLRQQRA
ncbi:MAG: hypothetical protein HY720_20565 [Planctomycetes bacterium]|nr:hypothetical protein [Planctomycetota bacterium]